MPFLKEARLNWVSVKSYNRFPYNIPALRGVNSIAFKGNVTFFVGENGSGKSTLLEAIARKCGFSDKGGGRNNQLLGTDDDAGLDNLITLSWMPIDTQTFELNGTKLHLVAYGWRELVS